MLQALASAKMISEPGQQEAGPPDTGERLMPASFGLAEVEALNAFYRRRSKLRITIAGDEMAIATQWPATNAADEPLCTIGLRVDDKAATLQLPLRLVERNLARVGASAGLGGLAPQHAALLLESALAGDLERLEIALGDRVELTSVERSGPFPQQALFAFVLTGNGETSACILHADDAELGARIGRLLDKAGAPPPVPTDFPLLICLRRSALTINLGMLRSLQPDDVILLDSAGKDDIAAVIVGERLFAPVTLTEAGPQLLAAPTGIAGSNWEWTMDQNTPPNGQTLEESSLDDLPVALAFEIGRTVMPVGEVRQLAPGAIVAFPGATDDTVDIIANGKRVGRGEVVRVGEHLGVRIVRMFDNA